MIENVTKHQIIRGSDYLKDIAELKLLHKEKLNAIHKKILEAGCEFEDPFNIESDLINTKYLEHKKKIDND